MAREQPLKDDTWTIVTITICAQRRGSAHYSKRDRVFEMTKEDFNRLSFAEILDDDLHDAVLKAPAFDVPGLY